MFYVQAITTPPQTLEDTPLVTRFPIAHGVIHRVELEFEKWCANLLHVTISRFQFQIYPLTPNSSFASDGEVVAFNDYFEVFEEPHELIVHTWNTDDYFEWTVRVRVGVMPEGVAQHMFGSPNVLDIEALRQALMEQQE